MDNEQFRFIVMVLGLLKITKEKSIGEKSREI